mmetsp:Transcript_75358/g.191176  ORF Transcript_75358/g.191176 Transcript_75358/m.191176 type:complete len:253 (-) Transcript_75358:30-788(-)
MFSRGQLNEVTYSGPVATSPHAMPAGAVHHHIVPADGSTFVGSRTCMFLVAAILVLDACLAGLVLLRRTHMPAPPVVVSAQIGILAALAVSGQGAAERGTLGTAERKLMENAFDGTTADGGMFGKVTLSQKAQQLREALEEQGFEHSTYYHGTKQAHLLSILNDGFLFADGWHGRGIYTTTTYEHAQCYAGGGNPVLELEVYYNPAAMNAYLRHVQHDSELNDVWLIGDPLIVIPTEVHECCSVEGGTLPCL